MSDMNILPMLEELEKLRKRKREQQQQQLPVNQPGLYEYPYEDSKEPDGSAVIEIQL